MTVKLECSDASNYIEVHLGCYDYCKASGVCERNETPVIKPTNPTTPVISEKNINTNMKKLQMANGETLVNGHNGLKTQ